MIEYRLALLLTCALYGCEFPPDRWADAGRSAENPSDATGADDSTMSAADSEALIVDAGNGDSGERIVALYAGGSTTVAVLADGRAWAWGRGVPEASDADAGPGLLEGARSVRDVAVDGYLCVLDEMGEVRCMGGNQYGSVTGAGDDTVLTRLELPVPALSLASGFGPLVLLEPGDEVQEHGRDGPTRPTFLPETARMLAAGGNFALALAASGSLYEWGASERPSVLTYLLGPRAIPDLPPSQHIVAGFYHACTLSKAGQVHCWGRNNEGQLGHEAGCDRLAPCKFDPRPVALDDATPVVRIAAGDTRSAAVTEAGDLYVWGSSTGKCDKGPPCGATPARVPLPAPAADVALGNAHVCTLLRDARVFCWGDNTYEQVQPKERNTYAFVTPTQVLPQVTREARSR